MLPREVLELPLSGQLQEEAGLVYGWFKNNESCIWTGLGLDDPSGPSQL